MYRFIIDKTVFTSFITFYTIFYVIPFSYITFYNNKGFVNLYNYEFSIIPLLIIILFPVLILILDFIFPKSNLNKTNIKQDLSSLFLLIFILLLVSSVVFSINFDLDFRQDTSKTLSNSGPFAKITFALKSIGRAYVFVVFLKFISGFQLRFVHKISVLVIVVSFLITIVAASDIFVIIAGALILFPNLKVAFTSKTSILKAVFYLAIVMITVIAVIFVGNANKIGLETALELFSSKDSWIFIIENTIKRISTFYVSTFANHEAWMSDYFYSLETLAGSLNNLAFRFFHLLGFDYNLNSEFWSINRLNFILLFQDTSNDVTGASPGVVAAIYQFPIFPLGLIFMLGYSIFILRSISSLLKNKTNNNLLTAFIIFTFMLPFFETPLDLVNIIDPLFIYIFSFFFLKKMM